MIHDFLANFVIRYHSHNTNRSLRNHVMKPRSSIGFGFHHELIENNNLRSLRAFIFLLRLSIMKAVQRTSPVMRLSVAIAVVLPCLVNCANILFLETVPSPSHHIWIRTLATALAERGHNITSLSTDIEEHTPDNLHYLHLDKVYDVMYNEEDEDFEQAWDFFEMGNINPYLQLLIFMDFTPLTLKGSLKSTGFHQLLAYPDDFKVSLI